jgi:hypothetical protein
MGYLRRPRARVLASRPSFARARLAIDPRARLARPLAPPPVVVGAVDERTRRRLATRDARARGRGARTTRVRVRAFLRDVYAYNRDRALRRDRVVL